MRLAYPLCNLMLNLLDIRIMLILQGYFRKILGIVLIVAVWALFVVPAPAFAGSIPSLGGSVFEIQFGIDGPSSTLCINATEEIDGGISFSGTLKPWVRDTYQCSPVSNPILEIYVSGQLLEDGSVTFTTSGLGSPQQVYTGGLTETSTSQSRLNLFMAGTYSVPFSIVNPIRKNPWCAVEVQLVEIK